MLDTVPSVSQNLFKFIFSQFIDENLPKFSELLKDNQNSDSSLYDSKACALNQYVIERSKHHPRGHKPLMEKDCSSAACFLPAG